MKAMSAKGMLHAAETSGGIYKGKNGRTNFLFSPCCPTWREGDTRALFPMNEKVDGVNRIVQE